MPEKAADQPPVDELVCRHFHVLRKQGRPNSAPVPLPVHRILYRCGSSRLFQRGPKHPFADGRSYPGIPNCLKTFDHNNRVSWSKIPGIRKQTLMNWGAKTLMVGISA